MFMDSDIDYKLEKIKLMDKTNAMKVLFMWIKDDCVNFKQFVKVLNVINNECKEEYKA